MKHILVAIMAVVAIACGDDTGSAPDAHVDAADSGQPETSADIRVDAGALDGTADTKRADSSSTDSVAALEIGVAEDVSTADATVIETTVANIKTGSVVAGQYVRLEDVVVSAVDGYGSYAGLLYVQDSAGGAHSGIAVFAPRLASGGAVTSLDIGNIVDVVGKVEHWTGPASSPFPNGKYVMQIASGAVVTDKGVGSSPTPTEISVATLRDPVEAEKFEGALVKIVAAKVSKPLNATYGEFRVVGGLTVDDELYLHSGVQVGDCYDITGILTYFYFHKLAPRNAADMARNVGGCVAKEVTISEIQDTTAANHPAPETEVSFVGVVTAVDSNPSTSGDYVGFWVQEGGTAGPYKGIYVYHRWTAGAVLQPPAVGFEVEITGVYTEFYGLSEINEVTAIEDLGAATPITPLTLAPADLATGGAEFEKYEGVLVTVGPLTVDSVVSNSAGSVHFGFVVTEADFDVKNDLYDFVNPTAPSGSYTSVTGVVTYGLARSQLLPRGAADLVR